MTTEKQKGFLLGIASKGFLRGGSGKLFTVKILKPQKCKIILSVTATRE